MRARIMCNNCNHKFIEDVRYFSDIVWECESCGSDEVALMEILDQKNDEFQLKGRGGCGKPGG